MKGHGPPMGAGRASKVLVSQEERTHITPGPTPHARPVSTLAPELLGVTCYTPARAAEVVADFAFAHRIRRLHACGPRVVAELLAELGAERSIMTVIEEKVDRYLAIPDATLDLVGGRKLPPSPLHAVP